MATIAVYSMKGGVGKTTLAVNLAWSSAVQSARRTLLWDLDPQGGASFLIGDGSANRDTAQSVFAKDVEPEKLIRPSTVPGLDLLAADISLRGLDHLLFSLGKKKRLAKLLESLNKNYDRVILDCPPGLTEISEQVMRAADLILSPVIPSPLSERALDEIVAFLDRQSGRRAPMLPIFSMVDRRRALHREAIERKPEWPVIPMASAIEQMAVHRAPVGSFALTSPAGQAFSGLWKGVERKLAKKP
ncbi:ParA family protein [Sphingobium boeckii]|uniref:Cellulose biosynthesis protein BcsQ n=1 Tax=Sphingobium boeckii TaxID=1082345 RepID=A0A7W9EDT4_9SPHN|nr:ParA family protein [Sphingobium boeckii]MBB5685608.1 cellulose biosynthesis protein BcsQ [Sphingobium boeckii]